MPMIERECYNNGKITTITDGNIKTISTLCKRDEVNNCTHEGNSGYDQKGHNRLVNKRICGIPKSNNKHTTHENNPFGFTLANDSLSRHRELF